MPNHKEPFLKRMSCNEAESKFESFCELRDIKYYKYGIDNHPFGKNFYKVKKVVRSTPDYIIDGYLTCFVEVKGCVNNIKLKEKDFHAYSFWNNIMTLNYCFYSKSRNQIKIINHNKLEKILPMCETDYMNDAHKYDNKLYYRILWSSI
tara:strand:- start:695 stop:1141 length:447 start_codon:yes stop_codon:yes gene_type:complete